MKWDEMTPRERDALVAEKVMELDLRSKNRTLYAIPETKNLQIVPSYTTDISAAWEVVRKVGMIFNLDGHYHTGWKATFDAQYESDAWEAPEAICLAALRASGVEV